MFIAINQFHVNAGREAEFEEAWRTRESDLGSLPGFVQFALLKCDDPGEYISHTTWVSREHFIAWAESDSFRKSHSRRLPDGVLAGHPRARFYDAVLVEQAPAAGL